MPASPLSPHSATPAELQERLAADRAGEPFVLYRDGDRAQRIVALPEGRVAVIGRDERSLLCLAWDERVSRLHADLSQVGGHWVLSDDGLSRHGTFLNGELVRGRRRLRDRDELVVGDTLLVFRDPASADIASTAAAGAGRACPVVSPAQHRVLVALCRPYRDGAAYATPATNEQIATELHLSVAAVKTHLTLLFQRFGLTGLPQNEKRAALARATLDHGLVRTAELS